MYISRVRLENIKGFSERRNVDLTLTRPDGSHAGWTVLVGENGSGSTSLLRAIALTVGGPIVARSLVPDLQAWITAGAKRSLSQLQLEVAPEDFQAQPGGVLLSMNWAVDPSRPGSQPLISATSRDLGNTDVPLSKTAWQPDPIGWFCAAYGPFRRLTGCSERAHRLMATPGPVARTASLFREDAALTEGARWLIDKHLRGLEGKEQADELRMSALQILADGLLSDDYEIAAVDSDGVWVTRYGRRFPLREMSDGYSTITALVIDLIKQFHDCYGDLHFAVHDGVPMITAPGVVIIDEVDAHLDESRQQRIGTWLKRHFPNVQFIVSAHSPYACHSADPGGLIFLPTECRRARS